MILDALALFHPATDIHGIGPYPGDGIGDVVDRQATGQDNRLAQILWYQRPVKCLTSSARHTFNIGIEQNTAGPCIRLAGAGDVITGLDPQGLDIRTVIAFALFRGFITMELQQVQRHGIQGFVQFTGTGVDEQPHRGHERRQCSNDGPGLQCRDCPRAFGVEHEAYGISTGLDRSQCIFYAGNTADLAANNGHLDNTPDAKAPDGNKCLSGRQPSRPLKPVKKCGPM